jgi:hypothetical protein
LFESKYGLKYKRGSAWTSATGDKFRYYSDYKIAETLGYVPRFTSLQTIEEETDKIIKERHLGLVPD